MPSPKLYTYDPDDVIVTIDGVTVTDWGPDGLVIARDEDHTTAVSGIKNDTTLNRNRNTKGTVAINLLGGSNVDKMFDEIQAVDDLYAFAIGIYIKSANKQLVTTGWYQTMPDLEAAAELGPRTHVLGVLNAIPSAIAAVGNLSSTIENAITQGN